MDLVARQLIRAIRGSRSQEAFSRRLGYTSNPVADWEAGRRFPTAAETLRACTLANIDVHSAFAAFRPEEAEHLGDADDLGVAAWLGAVRGTTSIKEVAFKVDRSRYAVSRWISGETRPRLPDFLRLVNALSDRLSDLIAALVEIDSVPSLADEHHQRHASRRLAIEEPWVSAVLVLLGTKGYGRLFRHLDGWIAERLDVPRGVELSCLQKLQQAGVVERDPKTGKYREVQALTIDAGLPALKEHWAKLGPLRATDPHDGDMVSYNVFVCSRDDLQRVREAHIRYFMEVRNIVANSEPEVAGIVNIQLLTWDAPR